MQLSLEVFNTAASSVMKRTQELYKRLLKSDALQALCFVKIIGYQPADAIDGYKLSAVFM